MTFLTERGAIGSKLHTFFGCRSARRRPPGWVRGRVVAYAAYADSWSSSGSSGSKTLGTWAGDRCLAERIASYVSTDGSARACGVGARPRFISTLGGPRETSGPQIDRIPPARPPWWRRQYRELKKIFFSPPSKCTIDLFGPVANGTTLERLRVVFLCLLVSYKPASSRFGSF